MIDKFFCRTMADYNKWMNERLYTLCGTLSDEERKREQGAFFGSIHSSLNHILYGDLSFMSRFTGEPTSPPQLGVDLYDDFIDLSRARQDLDQRICGWSLSLKDSWLRHELTYKSSVDGNTRTRSRWLLVAHMFNHQTHHRGQITTLLAQMGHDIGTTDLPFMDDRLR